MTRKSFQFTGTLCIVAALFVISLNSCENDLKDVERISSKRVSTPIDRSYGVEITFSDSAKVKGVLFTPELFYYRVANPYYRMPKGIKVIFYDAQMREENTITADSAIKRVNEQITELKGHVVITKKDGTTLKSDEFYWNDNTRKFYSSKDKLVTLKMPNGTEQNGYEFESDEKFMYKVKRSTGPIILPEQKQPSVTPPVQTFGPSVKP